MENINELKDLVSLANTYEELGDAKRAAEVDEVIRIIAQPESAFAETLRMFEAARSIEEDIKMSGAGHMAKLREEYQGAKQRQAQSQDPAQRQQIDNHLRAMEGLMTHFSRYINLFGGAAQPK